jgi:hypothetical protein
LDINKTLLNEIFILLICLNTGKLTAFKTNSKNFINSKFFKFSHFLTLALKVKLLNALWLNQGLDLILQHKRSYRWVSIFLIFSRLRNIKIISLQYRAHLTSSKESFACVSRDFLVLMAFPQQLFSCFLSSSIFFVLQGWEKIFCYFILLRR